MNELKNKIAEKLSEFQTNFFDNVDKGNKAAGARARKASLALEKLMKEYRKESVKA